LFKFENALIVLGSS